jgi:glycosyltransferase involved in cell wall biosynthesis
MASTPGPEFSLVIPVYRNEGSLPDLVAVCEELNRQLRGSLEVVFVVDGSPDRSFAVLQAALPRAAFRSQVLLLSRNFGSFPAIRAGLSHSRGAFFAVMAADLQEPPELILRFFQTLEGGGADVTLGTRTGRCDPFVSRLLARVFWGFYRRFVQRDMPPGGVDVFGCNRVFRDTLLTLRESHSSLVGLLFWLGYRREFIGYERRPRLHGKSAWSFNRKLHYLFDSVFSFTDFPVRLLTYAGVLGLCTSVGLGCLVVAFRLSGLITVPGYAATVLVIAFFAALNSFGLGIVGSYVWRAFENTKNRPDSLVAHSVEHGGGPRDT